MYYHSNPRSVRNNETVHHWANQVGEEGANKDRTIYWRKDKIFSYREAACMARLLPNGVVALTTETWSNTTSTHQTLVRYATNNRRQVHCYNAGDSADKNRWEAMAASESKLVQSESGRIREPTRAKLRVEAFNIAERFNEYLAALPEAERTCQPIDLATLEVDIERNRQIKAEADAKREAEQLETMRQQRAKTLELLEDWKRGEPIYASRLYEVPCALRIVGDIVETSHGAEVPVAHAKRLWPLISEARRAGQEFICDRPVGVYKLSQVNKDGSIVVGCHNIPYEAILEVAVQLNLEVPA